MSTPYRVDDLAPMIGSEITGLDLSQPLDTDTLASLRALWLERKGLFFRDQTLTPDQQPTSSPCPRTSPT